MCHIKKTVMVAIIAMVLGCWVTVYAEDQKVDQKGKSPIKESEIKGTGAIIKVTDLKKDIKLDNSLIKPKDGFIFIGVQVIIDNTNGKTAIKSNSMYFILKDTDGTRFNSSIFKIIEPHLVASDIDAGDKIKGWIGFEIQKNTNIDKLQIRYESFSDKSDWINITE